MNEPWLGLRHGLIDVIKAGKRPGWSTRVVLKYALLQVPGIAVLVLSLILVRRWVDVPSWIAWVIVALWIAKDVVLFPFVWRAYDRGRPGDPLSMIGQRGITEDRLNPSGYAKVRGELWQVEVKGGGPPIEKGEAVRVSEINGLTLIVQPDMKENTE